MRQSRQGGKQPITIKCKEQLAKFISQNYGTNNKAPGKCRGAACARDTRHETRDKRQWTKSEKQAHVGMLIVTCSFLFFSVVLFRAAYPQQKETHGGAH